MEKHTKHKRAAALTPKQPLKPEDIPVEKIYDIFKGMPCEFTEDDFRDEEIEAAERASVRRPS